METPNSSPDWGARPGGEGFKRGRALGQCSCGETLNQDTQTPP